MTTPIHGVLVIDKPIGPTSHDVVAHVRRTLHAKAGHTGTLDPLASGVLPVLLGNATRLMRFFQGNDKVYDAEIRLGRITATFDSEGPVVATAPVPVLPLRRIEEILTAFTGDIQQLPPMFSAVKVGGEPLYKKARKGEVLHREPRPVTIHSLQLLDLQPDLWRVRVHCSSGTYVRALAHDIGGAVGCGAYLASLRRLRSGCFDLERSVTQEAVAEDWKRGFQPMESLLPELPRIDLTAEQARRVRHGNAIECHPDGEFLRLFSQDRLMAIAAGMGSHAEPVAVFADDSAI